MNGFDWPWLIGSLNPFYHLSASRTNYVFVPVFHNHMGMATRIAVYRYVREDGIGCYLYSTNPFAALRSEDLKFINLCLRGDSVALNNRTIFNGYRNVDISPVFPCSRYIENERRANGNLFIF
jgi:hypothetical protein